MRWRGRGPEIRGYIGSTGSSSFKVVDPVTGVQQDVDYSDVVRVSAQNLTTGQKIEIGVAILVAVLVAIAFGTLGA